MPWADPVKVVDINLKKLKVYTHKKESKTFCENVKPLVSGKV
jgi:hypothetical protein